MLKYTFVVAVLFAGCGGKSKGSEAPAPSGSCDPVGTWELHFTWQGDAPAACGTDVPWDQPFTVTVTKPQAEATVEEDAQKTPWASTTVKGTQMVGNVGECSIGFVAAGQAGGRDVNLNIGPLHQSGTSASGDVELNRPAATDGGEGCSRKGSVTATKK